MWPSSSEEEDIKTDIEAELKEYEQLIKDTFGDTSLKVSITKQYIVSVSSTKIPYISVRDVLYPLQVKGFNAKLFVKKFMRKYNNSYNYYKHHIPALQERVRVQKKAASPALKNNFYLVNYTKLLEKDVYWMPANNLERKLHPVLSKQLDKLMITNAALKNQPPKDAKEAEFL